MTIGFTLELWDKPCTLNHLVPIPPAPPPQAVCEALIMALTKVAVEPMLSFITKVRGWGIPVREGILWTSRGAGRGLGVDVECVAGHTACPCQGPHRCIATCGRLLPPVAQRLC